MRDKLTDTIRVGKISSVNPDNCTAQVTFEDRDDVVSGDLFITVPFTLKDKAYYMPAVGERVRVLFDPESPATGCILGSFYADTRLPPFGDANKTYVNFEDGTLIEYDKRLHILTVSVAGVGGVKSVDVVAAADVAVKSGGGVRVETASEVVITCAADVVITANANITINAAGNVEIKAGGAMLVESGGAMTIKGASVDIN